MSLDILKQRLKDNSYPGVYLFYGKEEYTKNFYVTQLRKSINKSPLPEFNHILINAAESSPQALTEAVYSLPFMWDYKLIEVRNFEKNSVDSEVLEEYIDVLDDLPDYVVLLFLFRSQELDDSDTKPSKSRTKSKSKTTEDDGTKETRQSRSKRGISALVQGVRETGVVVEFEPQSGALLEKWVVKHFTANNIKGDLSIARYLINYCGTDMYTLSGEVAKLSFAKPGQQITESDIKTFCSPNESFMIYELTDALLRGNTNSAIKVFYGLIAQKTEPDLILGYLSRIFTDHVLVRELFSNGQPSHAIAKAITKPEWMVRRMITSIQNNPEGFFAYCCDHIDQADRKIKSYSLKPYLVLELLIIRIGNFNNGKG